MSQQTLSADPAASLAQVWTHLASDLRERVIHLVAQLAFNLVVAQSDWLGKEYTRDLSNRQTKDPA